MVERPSAPSITARGTKTLLLQWTGVAPEFELSATSHRSQKVIMSKRIRANQYSYEQQNCDRLQFEVRAVNECGIGPWSAPLKVSYGTEPSKWIQAPSLLQKTATTVHVEWTPCASPACWHVLYWGSEREEKRQYKITKGYTEHDVLRLRTGDDYQFCI